MPLFPSAIRQKSMNHEQPASFVTFLSAASKDVPFIARARMTSYKNNSIEFNFDLDVYTNL